MPIGGSDPMVGSPPTASMPASHSGVTSVAKAAWVLSAFLMGAIGAGGSVQAATFAYVGNAGSNEISVFQVGNTGAMMPVETVPFPGISKPGSSTPMRLSPDHHTLFAGVRSEPYTVVSFTIDPKTGRLHHIANGTLANSMANIATDNTGRFLFSASYGGNMVAVNPIAPGGAVQPPIQVIPTGIMAHCILPDHNNRFVFATNLGSDQVLAFRFDQATGKLTPSQTPVIKMDKDSGPRHFIFSPNQRFIYLVDELDGAVRVFSYNANIGTWKPLQRVSTLPEGFTGKPWAADIHLTPNGRYLFASERTTSRIVSFKVDPKTGTLTPAGSVETEKQPRGFNIDPSGHFLAAVGELSDDMTVYAIDQATGALKKVDSYKVGKQPNWVEFVTYPRG
jgi:6-phosphogluconolactonase